MYCRTIAAGEQSGNLDMVLKRMADLFGKECSRGKESEKRSHLSYYRARCFCCCRCYPCPFCPAHFYQPVQSSWAPNYRL